MLDELGGWDAGFRMYCEDIDLNYRAAKAGWSAGTSGGCRARTSSGRRRKRFSRGSTGLACAGAMARFLRKHPERLLALSMSTVGQVRGGAEGWSEDAYADAPWYLARRAEPCVSSDLVSTPATSCSISLRRRQVSRTSCRGSAIAASTRA